MDNVINNYQQVRDALTLEGQENGKPYLPEATRVNVTRSPVITFKSPAELLTEVTSVFSDSNVWGWITLQSNTLVITDKAGLMKAMDNQYLISGELSDGASSAQLYFENGQWHMTTLHVAADDNGDALAFSQHYALDGIRFPDHASGTIHYQVIWQHTSQGLAPVAQHLQSIRQGDEE